MHRLDLQDTFGTDRPIIGMVHLLPLPGSHRARPMDAVLERAVADAAALDAGGVHGIMIENFGDAPFFPDAVPPETIAAITCAVAEVRRVTGLPLGVNVLRNDARAALAIAAVTGAAFIRVNVHVGAMLTDQGWISGRAHETLRTRTALAAHVAILADVLVKHATPPHGLTAAAAARDCWQRGAADALIVTGTATGAAAPAGTLREVRHAVPDAPILAGSGVTPDSIADVMRYADGVIVGTALQRGGTAGPVDRDLVHALASAAAAQRGRTPRT